MGRPSRELSSPLPLIPVTFPSSCLHVHAVEWRTSSHMLTTIACPLCNDSAEVELVLAHRAASRARQSDCRERAQVVAPLVEVDAALVHPVEYAILHEEVRTLAPLWLHERTRR